MVGEYGDVICTSLLYLQHEGLHGGLPTEGEHSSMVEDIVPQLHMDFEDMSWELFEEWFRERYLSEEFIECQLNEFNALRQGIHTVPEYEAHFMEFLQYDPHLNTKKLKVNRFLFGLNVSIHVKVRIFMP
jgi:hypothetical protein